MAPAASVLVTAAVLLAACSQAGDPVRVGTAPPAAPAARDACQALAKALPDTVDGRKRRETEPSSDLVWAWGDPALIVRCGVARPSTSTPGADLVEVNSVDWTLDETPTAYVFTTYGRRAFVEVAVPKATPRTRATASLVDLAAAVRDSDPLG